MKSRIALALGLVAAFLFSKHAEAQKTVVLVHGAFADGSSWNKIIPILEAKGLKVISVQHPLTGLADDVAAVKRVLDQQTSPVVLVGHSWGGTIITEAGNSDKVGVLVYVAAFAPDDGQSVADATKGLPTPPGLVDAKPDANGFLWLSDATVLKHFAPDVPAAEGKLIAATQGPIAAKSFGDKISTAAWKKKPSFYIVAKNDHMISPDLEAQFAKKMNATTTVLATSHVPMLSKPKDVAAVILAAVDKLK